jgi:hypothetical protein
MPAATATETPTDTPVPVGQCAPAPLTGCKVPTPLRGSLALYKPTDPNKSKLRWKWLQGNDTQFSELGSPIATTDYRLCIYDGAGTLIMNLAAPAGGICGTRPCWKATLTRYVYVNKAGTPNGLRRLLLQSGPAGKARIVANARGLHLNLPTLPLTQAPNPVRAQLINSTTPACWEASFSAPAQSAVGGTLKWRDHND